MDEKPRPAIMVDDEPWDLDHVMNALVRMKYAHDELEARYAEAVRLQELKDDLVRMLVHDLKNPITCVMSYLELMGQERPGNPGNGCGTCTGYIQSALHMARKMGSMVYDLLDLSKMESGMMPMNIERVAIKDVVLENIRDFGYALGQKNLGTEVDERPGGQSVGADRALMSRVVGNILGNAIRHSPEGGRIAFFIAAAGGVTELSIENEGPRIPEDALEKIFDKFHQAVPGAGGAGSGAGLGLAFSRMVVEAHGGDIRAENLPGTGCRFTMRLPSHKRW